VSLASSFVSNSRFERMVIALQIDKRERPWTSVDGANAANHDGAINASASSKRERNRVSQQNSMPLLKKLTPGPVLLGLGGR
jgi:hypothetical protein